MSPLKDESLPSDLFADHANPVYVDYGHRFQGVTFKCARIRQGPLAPDTLSNRLSAFRLYPFRDEERFNNKGIGELKEV